MTKTQTGEPVQIPLEGVTPEAGAAVFTEAAEVLSNTAAAIWEKQLNLLRIEVEQTQKGVSALTAGESAGAAFGAYVAGVQGGIETALTDMREINDLVRDCSWRLLDLYTRQMQRGMSLFVERPAE
jgi:Phasin protein